MSFHVEKVAAPSHGRTCAGVCAFFAVSVACTKQVSYPPEHVQVCTLNRCFLHQFTSLQTDPPQGMHVRSCMLSLFIRVEGYGWGKFSYLYRALVAGVGRYFSHKER